MLSLEYQLGITLLLEEAEKKLAKGKFFLSVLPLANAPVPLANYPVNLIRSKSASPKTLRNVWNSSTKSGLI